MASPFFSLKAKVLKIKHPSDFFKNGLKPYPEQEDGLDAMHQFLESDARLMLANEPTASGKTYMAMATGQAYIASGQGKVVILGQNNEQIDQFSDSFAKKEILKVMGSGAYKCSSFKKRSCGEEVSRWKCPSRKGSSDDLCPYRKARKIADSSDGSVPFIMSPHTLMSLKSSPSYQNILPSDGGLLIVDEAHLLPELLAQKITLKLPIRMIEGLLSHEKIGDNSFNKWFFGKTPRQNISGESMIAIGSYQTEYLELLRGAIEAHLNEKKQNLGFGSGSREGSENLSSDEDGYVDEDSVLGADESSRWGIRYLEALRTTLQQLETFLSHANETMWAAEVIKVPGDSVSEFLYGQIPDEEEALIQIRPGILPASYLERFFSGFSKVILMSGTIYLHHAIRLGLARPSALLSSEEIKGIKHHVGKSRIQPARRMIHIDKVGGRSVSSKTIDDDFEFFAKRIVDVIAPKFPGAKGIIHVTSHAQAEKFARMANLYSMRRKKQREQLSGEECNQRARFITTEGKSFESTLAKWKKLPGQIKKGETTNFLVVVRRYEGLDLKDDLSRINIILKYPHSNHTDTIVKTIDSIIRGYSAVNSLSSFFQAGNRTSRTGDDWSFIVCLDTSAERAVGPHLESSPQYMKEQVKIEEDINWITNWKIPR